MTNGEIRYLYIYISNIADTELNKQNKNKKKTE